MQLLWLSLDVLFFSFWMSTKRMQQVLVIKNKTKQLSVAIIFNVCYITVQEFTTIGFPNPCNLFNGSTDNGTDCGNTMEHLYCSDNFMNTLRLVDGDTGPLHSLSSTNLH